MNQFLVGRQEENVNLLYKEHKRKRDRGGGAVNAVFLLREFANVGQSRNCGTYQYRDVRLAM